MHWYLLKASQVLLMRIQQVRNQCLLPQIYMSEKPGAEINPKQSMGQSIAANLVGNRKYLEE